MRNATILVSYDRLKLLHAWAYINGGGGAGAAEAVLEGIIDEWVKSKPELLDRVKCEEQALKQARAEWAAKWKRQPSDEITL